MARPMSNRRLIYTLGAGLLVVLIAVGAGLLWWQSSRGTPQDRLRQEIARELDQVETVKGRLTISLAGASLTQELWVQRPNLLRTETEAGPGAFAGTIVVLNADEGWVYSPALNMATVVDRAEYQADLAGEAGAGSLLERMPDSILAALAQQSTMHLGERSSVAGRAAIELQVVIPPGDPSFPAGPLQVWLDAQYSYPLAWRDSNGRELRFQSVSFNTPIEPEVFVFVPPPGAAVQRVDVTPQP